MKRSKKFSAIICAIAMIVSTITYYPTNNVSAATYDSLTYTTLDSNLSYCIVSQSIEGWNAPFYGDGGATFQLIYSADNKKADTKISINGTETTSGVVTFYDQGIVKVNPQLFEDNAYTEMVITTTTGSANIIFKKGNPSGGGEIVTTTNSSGEVITPGQGTTNPSGTETTKQSEQTTAKPATSLPKRVFGLDAVSKSGSDTIENAIMFAWAGADDTANVAGYDPTVTATVIYIYKDGKLVTKIGNATKGGVVGGLSAGSYTAQAANVNSMGEGPLSETVSFTVTGATLNYTYPVSCIGPKTPAGLSYITGNPEVPADNPAQADNKLGVAWAPSSEASIPSADSSVVGYNLYLFDAKTGTPYRRVYVDGITNSNVILESVSAGEYLAYLSAVDAQGRESTLAATSFGQPSKVTVKGQFIDNAQSFDKPNQPTLPLGLSILTEGIDYGFTIAWSDVADLTGQRLNLFVDGVCIKVGINTDVASYYENRLATGTYEVEVRSQYTSNNVESFGLKKTVSIKADPGLSVRTPAELADPAYSEYEEPTTNPTTTAEPTTTAKPTSENETPVVETTPSGETTPEIGTTTGKTETTSAVETTKPKKSDANVETTTKKQPSQITKNSSVRVGKAVVKKAVKNKNAKKISLKLKRVKGAIKYKVQIAKDKKFKKIIVTKTTKKLAYSVLNGKFKKTKKLYARAKAIIVKEKKIYQGKWSNPKLVKIKK